MRERRRKIKFRNFRNYRTTGRPDIQIPKNLIEP